MKNRTERVIRQGIIGLASIVTTMFPPQLGKTDNAELPEPVAYSYDMPEINVKADPLPFSLDYIAGKNIGDLTSEEKSHLVQRLKKTESNNNPNAVSFVIRKSVVDGMVVPDTIYSKGENQINTSESGALEDYNQNHARQFSEEDMFNPRKNGIVSRWYLFERIPKMLEQRGLEKTVANVLASYNTGIGNLRRMSYGDAIKNFDRLPKITQKYIRDITRNGD